MNTSDLDDLKPQPGDVITAEFVNTLIDKLKELEQRVQELEEEPDSTPTPTTPFPTTLTPTFSSVPTAPDPTLTASPPSGSPTVTFPTMQPRPTFTAQPESQGQQWFGGQQFLSEQQAFGGGGGDVTSLKGIGRDEASKLADAGFPTLTTLAGASASDVENALDVSKKEAEEIVKKAYSRTGGQTGRPLTELADIGMDAASSMQSAGIQSLESLAESDPELVKQSLGVESDQAKSLINNAKNVVGG